MDPSVAVIDIEIAGRTQALHASCIQTKKTTRNRNLGEKDEIVGALSM